MAKSALTQLQDQIEAIRREAFAAGYAAAMQSVREAIARPMPGVEAAVTGRPRTARAGAAAPARKAAPITTAGQPRRHRRVAKPTAAAGSRPRRGTNARLIEEVLQAIGPRGARPAEIRAALQRDKGVAMAFTSIRHSLGQLESRGAVEQIADSKTWRHVS